MLQDADKGQLKKLSGKQENVYYVEDYNQLSGILNDVARKACSILSIHCM